MKISVLAEKRMIARVELEIDDKLFENASDAAKRKRVQNAFNEAVNNGLVINWDRSDKAFENPYCDGGYWPIGKEQAYVVYDNGTEAYINANDEEHLREYANNIAWHDDSKIKDFYVRKEI